MSRGVSGDFSRTRAVPVSRSADFSFDEVLKSDVKVDYTVKNPIQKIFAHRHMKGGDTEYFIKKTDFSYRNACWVPKSFFATSPGGMKMLKTYTMANEQSPKPPYYNTNYDIADKIIGNRGKTEFLVKWVDLDYDAVTWETEDGVGDDAMIEQYWKDSVAPSSEWFQYVQPSPRLWKRVTELPCSKKGFTARPYQLEGVNFIVNCWYNRRNTILADEMGLGKTLQSTMFMRYLYCDAGVHGPFLVIGPLSTIAHWEREIREWTDLKVLTFCGIRERRRLMKQYEMFYEKTKKPKFDVFVTTYEYLIKEQDLLSRVQWRCMVLDEAHRLKNSDSKVTISARSIQTDYKLLLTGTPVQNRLQELWTLLNFMDPRHYESWPDFEAEYAQLDNEISLDGLKAVLRPVMLRRMKSDVERTIKPLEEVIIECHMTKHQNAYYKAVFQKNMDYLSRGAHRAHSTNLNNVSMELRKVCNHPYLLKGAEDQILVERAELFPEQAEDRHFFVNDSLIRSSGKMILLDKLLTKLRSGGHRVLIFSMMVRVLEILGDYCTYKGYKFVQLDGSVRGSVRQTAIDAFNAPDSEYFVFLLMTRAGGVGINLASADTVIIYDSDWNPQSDIQAIARCHRIGQDKDVKVYRFLVGKSYERKMFDRASRKLGLDHAVLDGSAAAEKISRRDMDKLIRLGAYYALEENEDQNTEQYNEEDIDLVLSKSERIRHETYGNGESTFSKAEFIVDEEVPVDLDDPEYWEKYKSDSGGTNRLIMPTETIAERRMRDRDVVPQMWSDEGEDNEEHGDDVYVEELKGDIDSWTKGKFGTLISALCNYGYDRWAKIVAVGHFSCDWREVKAVSHVVLKWLIEASAEKFPVAEELFKSSTVKMYAKFEAKFARKKKQEFEKIVAVNASHRLKKIDMLYHLNNILSTCPHPPNDIIVPEVPSCPVEWWTQQDDRILLTWIWENGLSTFSGIALSNPEVPPKAVLTGRFKTIVNGVKQIFHRYSTSVGQDVSFNHGSLTQAVISWTKRDHKTVIHYLLAYGFPSAEQFREIAGFNNKTVRAVDCYVKTILGTAEESETVTLVEPMHPVTLYRGKKRVELLQSVRQLPREKLKDVDREPVELVSKVGFLKLTDSPVITNIFGTEGVEGKLVRYLKNLTCGKAKALPRATPRKNNVPDALPTGLAAAYDLDDDGNPVLPIKLCNGVVLISLGKVVYNRPKFQSPRYMYTDGFRSEKYMTSVRDPSEREWYVSTITDDGGDVPVFNVFLKDHPEIVFSGNSPSNPWTAIVRAIGSRKNGVSGAAVSGPESYGLSSPITAWLLSKLPYANKCTVFMNNLGLNAKREDRRRTASSSDKEESADNGRKPRRSERRGTSDDSRIPLIVDFAALLANARKLVNDEMIAGE